MIYKMESNQAQLKAREKKNTFKVTCEGLNSQGETDVGQSFGAMAEKACPHSAQYLLPGWTGALALWWGGMGTEVQKYMEEQIQSCRRAVFILKLIPWVMMEGGKNRGDRVFFDSVKVWLLYFGLAKDVKERTESDIKIQ